MNLYSKMDGMMSDVSIISWRKLCLWIWLYRTFCRCNCVVVWIEGMPGTVQTSNVGQDLVEWSCQFYIGSWVAKFVDFTLNGGFNWKIVFFVVTESHCAALSSTENLLPNLPCHKRTFEASVEHLRTFLCKNRRFSQILRGRRGTNGSAHFATAFWMWLPPLLAAGGCWFPVCALWAVS